MTDASARAVANAILITAGAAAAYIVITSPPLRRLAAIGIRWWLGAGVPAFLIGEVKTAWEASGRRPSRMR
jgi:hypothetical protein